MATRLGLSINLAEPAVVEIAAWLGYDFAWIDCEQTLFPNLAEVIRAAEAAGIEAWVRVPRNDPAELGLALNLGARGIIVPHVNSPDDARCAVRNAKLQPVGLRNWFSKARDARYGLVSAADYPARRNAATRLIVQVEEPEGIAAIGDILAVAGIDMVMTGPGDLAHCLGIPGQLDDPRIMAAEATVFAAADARGIPVVHFASSAREAAELRAAHPVEYLVIASDTTAMLSFLRERIAEIRCVVAREQEQRGEGDG